MDMTGGVIQDPPLGKFSALSLVWTLNQAIIPWERLTDFRDGEGKRDPKFETSFYIRTSKKSDSENTDWVEYKILWCSYGPQEHNVNLCVPPLQGTHPKSGIGSRPRLCKKNFNNHAKRNCQCHFIAKRFKMIPDAVQITYSNRIHCNLRGDIVHGSWEHEMGPPSWGPKCSVAPWLTNELQKHLEDLLRAKWSVLDIYDLHCQSQFERDGDDRGHNVTDMEVTLSFDGRDDLLSKQDLRNLKRKIDKELWLWDDNDQASMRKWKCLYPERVFLSHEYLEGPPEQEFMLGLQSPWQLAQMTKLSHGSVLALDSTFAINKYGFPFFTLVAFDEHQMRLPIAWCIQQSESAEHIGSFLQAVKDRALLTKPDWSPSCFIIDCAQAEVSALQAVFPNIPIYFCSWHVRRAWKENLIKKVPNRAKLLNMNDDLGDLMYAETEEDMQALWHAFKIKYNSEKLFLKYFEDTWMCRTAKWMRAVRSMPRANQNTNGAIEAWHCTLKKMIRRVIGAIGARRLDRIVNALFQVMLPFFWYQIRCKARGRVINYKKEEIVLNSLHKAEHRMKDHQVCFPDPTLPNQAIVKSLKPHGREYIVRNIYSNFPSCCCKWADEGNMCKHQLKALLVRGCQGAVLVQQLGTRFGSLMGGISHLNADENILTPPEHVEVEGQVEPHAVCETMESSLHVFVLPKENPKRSLRQSVQQMFDEILLIVEGDARLTEQVFLATQLTLNKVKSQEQTKHLSMKDNIGPVDAFVRPMGLTSKRRLGVVDIYHGGKRGRRTMALRTTQTREQAASSQIITNMEEDGTTPCKLPSKRKVVRESIRQHLSRLGKEFKDGRRQRRTANQFTPPLLARVMHLGGGARDVDINTNIDLNVSLHEEAS